MLKKDLKDLKRKELLEILLEQEKQNERLIKELNEAREELNNRKIKIQNMGSFAEAILALNGVYEDVDKAANEYLENIKKNNEESEKIIEAALQKAKDIVEDAEKIRQNKLDEANSYMDDMKQKLKRYYSMD